MNKISERDHRLWTVWAADCAEHVLFRFEDVYPDDDRPRKAIEAARAYVRGELDMQEVRKFAFAAHAAARDATRPESIAAARSAGHAAATAHVYTHAKHAATYALKSAIDPGREREWQLLKLPESLNLEG
jgi:hypothetical protein